MPPEDLILYRIKELEDRMTKHESAHEALLFSISQMKESLGPWSAAFKVAVFVASPLIGVVGTLLFQHFFH